MYGPEYYNKRALELEQAAAVAIHPNMRASYRDLASAFREMANLTSVAPHDETVGFPERMVGTKAVWPKH